MTLDSKFDVFDNFTQRLSAFLQIVLALCNQILRLDPPGSTNECNVGSIVLK